MHNGILFFISSMLLVLMLGFYLITNLQWYNYKLERVIFKSKKPLWHLWFFLLPIAFYYLNFSRIFLAYEFLAILPTLALWHNKLDKKLVFTARVKRFFLFLFVSSLFINSICCMSGKCNFGLLIPIMMALGFSSLYEKMLFDGFYKDAMKKLKSQNTKIIALTASYGKTTIKNIIYQILEKKFKTYKTPRSVNTLVGLVQDVNQNLPQDCEIYIAEAGARERGDILEIAHFLQHHYTIVGKVGEQHIEYFGSLENIRNTKMELIKSPNLKKAFIHKSANINPTEKIEEFGDKISNIDSTLDGLKFDLELNGEIHKIDSPLLGDFNAINITASIKVAMELGLSISEIKESVRNLKQTPHRLQKIESGGKIIIDDSYNGNYEGMISSYKMVSSYEKTKVLVTPGIVESTIWANIELAKVIDEIFDLVIITGDINSNILDENIKNSAKVVLKDKTKLEEVLAQNTKSGDLILFSNDTPNFM